MINTEQFVFAGNATFTVTSKRTGTRFTYKVQKSKDGNRFYVSLLNGPDNESSFRFFGTVFIDEQGKVFRHSKPERTPITPSAPSAQGFAWLARNLSHPDKISAQVEIHHEGRCGRCGRKLTVPSSIDSGIGPECASLMGL